MASWQCSKHCHVSSMAGEMKGKSSTGRLFLPMVGCLVLTTAGSVLSLPGSSLFFFSRDRFSRVLHHLHFSSSSLNHRPLGRWRFLSPSLLGLQAWRRLLFNRCRSLFNFGSTASTCLTAIDLASVIVLFRYPAG
ncbi:hypothetical protein GGI35DRAFT_117137 [Trichoderma velutinum]